MAMRRLLFPVILYLLVVLLTGCSKSDKEAKRPQMETSIIMAARSEASAMLLRIMKRQNIYKAKNGVYLKCLPSPPDGGTDAIPDVWVDAGGFEEILFRAGGTVSHQYSVTVSEDGQSCTITAVSDLDKNGVKAVYTITNSNFETVKTPEDEY